MQPIKDTLSVFFLFNVFLAAPSAVASLSKQVVTELCIGASTPSDGSVEVEGRAFEKISSRNIGEPSEASPPPSPKDVISLSTDRLQLKAIGGADAANAEAILFHEGVLKYQPEVENLDAAKKGFRDYAYTWQKSIYRFLRFGIGNFVLAIRVKENLIGISTLNSVSSLYGSKHIIDPKKWMERGTTILPEHWGKGYSTEAGEAVLRFAFETLGLEGMVSIVHKDNKASLRVIQKNGFQIDETVQGDLPDFIHFYITREQYFEKR
jgi:RimJ/RimL family protein N-acetyltransferase